MPISTRGRLLVASPDLVDPNFRRTVVLVVEHNEDGAMGIVLNRPTEAEVSEVVPALAGLADEDDVVHSGGPVEPDSVLALGDFVDPGESGKQVADLTASLPSLSQEGLQKVYVMDNTEDIDSVCILREDASA